MSTTLATSSVSEHLLASRELVSLGRATTFLVGRMRTRTPLGAAEYLEALSPLPAMRGLASPQFIGSFDWQKVYEARLHLAADLMAIYGALLPEHYARSTAPLYSTQREHEFYLLIHGADNFFPLVVDPEIELAEVLERDPGFCLPMIPVRGMQIYSWAPGRFELEDIPIPFQLAVTLGWVAKDNAAWKWMVERYGLDELNDFEGIETPAPPLASIGWTQFVYSCRVEGEPLKWLPMAFDMISYKTGNVWLDLPPGYGQVGFKWSLQQMAGLSIRWAKARYTAIAMTTLHNWFLEDPQTRIAAAIHLWNEAARVEIQSGLAGMLPEDLIEAGIGRPAGIDHRGQLVALPHQLLHLNPFDEAALLALTEGAEEFE